MYIDHIEYVTIIDNVIDIETEKAVHKDLMDTAYCGCELPTNEELPIYVKDMREAVQDILEQSN